MNTLTEYKVIITIDELISSYIKNYESQKNIKISSYDYYVNASKWIASNMTDVHIDMVLKQED